MSRDGAWQERISHDPAVCHGKAVIKGTRIMVSIILANLADGMSKEDIIEAYPSLTVPDIEAALHYAAVVTTESIFPMA